MYIYIYMFAFICLHIHAFILISVCVCLYMYVPIVYLHQYDYISYISTYCHTVIHFHTTLSYGPMALYENISHGDFRVHFFVELHILRFVKALYVPSGNQTWQWEILCKRRYQYENHLYHLYMVYFPLPRLIAGW